ncbi:MAG: hypothetical protein ABEK36_03430 [Candidatus Aenigmatarchaeota archaeon]
MLMVHITFANIASGFDKHGCEMVSLLKKQEKYLEENKMSEIYIFSSLISIFNNNNFYT